MEEIGGSIQIIHQYLQKRPSGPIRTDNAKQAYPSKDEVYYSTEGLINDFMMTDIGICPPEGAESYHGVESPKGEHGHYIQSDGTGKRWRLQMKAPSFTTPQVLAQTL